jgi:hypothetical protein
MDKEDGVVLINKEFKPDKNVAEEVIQYVNNVLKNDKPDSAQCNICKQAGDK